MNNSDSDDCAQQTPESDKLDLSTKIAFGAGDLGTAITAMIGISYLSPFLTDVAGLKPQLAGQTQLIGKVWDAINDPMVGVLSDRTQSQQGRRYPWMIWGAIPFGVFFFCSGLSLILVITKMQISGGYFGITLLFQFCLMLFIRLLTYHTLL